MTVAILAGTAALLAAALGYRNDDPGSWKALAMAAVWTAPGLVVAFVRPRLPLGWLALGQAAVFAAVGLADEWARSVVAGRAAAALDWAVWTTDRAGAVLAVGFGVLLVLLPDGRLPSARWRPVVATTVALQLLVLVVFATARGPAAGPDSTLPAAAREVPNPVGILPAEVGAMVQGWDVVVLQLPLLLALAAVVVRLRRAGPDERARVVTVLLAVVTCVLVVVLGHAWWPAAADALDVAASALLVTTLTATVLGRRPRSVAVLVREALVLTVLAACIGGLTATISAVSGQRMTAFGTGVLVGGLALAAHPLRIRLQRLVDRVVHGDLADPYRALQGLAERTYHAPTLAGVLEGLAASAAASLRVPWAAARAAGSCAAVGRRPSLGEEDEAPLAGELRGAGTLRVAWGPGRTATADERRLLAELARHGEPAVRAVVLADELRAGRHHLVLAREEERRRLRRDLHDEIGPTLAGLTMQLGVVRTLVAEDPGAAADRLTVLQDAAREALGRVRRVAHDLRPPALDELGLVGALAQLAESLGLGLRHGAGEVARLPAAVEVAAYRIGAEALHNVVRHSGTDQAILDLDVVDDELVLEIRDHGAGRPSGSPGGVGLLAMRERAEELGGRLDIDSAPGSGTRVTARIPFRPATVQGAAV